METSIRITSRKRQLIRLGRVSSPPWLMPRNGETNLVDWFANIAEDKLLSSRNDYQERQDHRHPKYYQDCHQSSRNQSLWPCLQGDDMFTKRPNLHPCYECFETVSAHNFWSCSSQDAKAPLFFSRETWLCCSTWPRHSRRRTKNKGKSSSHDFETHGRQVTVWKSTSSKKGHRPANNNKLLCNQLYHLEGE